MGTGNGIDAVQLHESQAMDQVQQGGSMCCTLRAFGEGMPVKKQAPRVPVVQNTRIHPRP
jgi:hypothetical protein